MPEIAAPEVSKTAKEHSEAAPAKKKASFNSFQIAQIQFDKVAEYLGLDPATRELLRYPMREFHFAIPARMDDGTVKDVPRLPRPAQ